MGIRQALNERPALTLGASFALLLGAVVILVVKGSDGRLAPAGPVGDSAFYSDDDGQTVFVDDLKHLTPFTHGGKEAVRAYVYRCGRGRFVGYLQRHTEYGRRQNSALEMGTRPTFAPQAIYEIKRPGPNSRWVPVDQKNFSKVMEILGVSCADDPNDTPVLIYPGQ